MPKALPKNPQDFIAPLYMNHLHGRMLYLPPKNSRKRRQILLVYGHHASLERMFGLAEELNKYGAVTMPDLPGFGGMESFYKIGEKPTLDNLADYLAAFVKLRYKRRRVTIMGMSFGFLVVTRMLQRYPELAGKVDMLVSIVGFAHKQDFRFKKHNYLLLRYGLSLLSNRGPAWLVKTLVLRGPLIRATYALISKTNDKFLHTTKETYKQQVDFEVNLWRNNDPRTQAETAVSMLTVDLCDKRVDLPVYHTTVKNDRYFDNHMVIQHLNVIFNSVIEVPIKAAAHAPTVIAEAKDAAPFIPVKLRRVLAKS